MQMGGEGGGDVDEKVPEGVKACCGVLRGV